MLWGASVNFPRIYKNGLGPLLNSLNCYWTSMQLIYLGLGGFWKNIIASTVPAALAPCRRAPTHAVASSAASTTPGPPVARG